MSDDKLIVLRGDGVGVYEIWDHDTMNMLGSFESLLDACRVLVELADANPEYAKDLLLGYWPSGTSQ